MKPTCAIVAIAIKSQFTTAVEGTNPIEACGVERAIVGIYFTFV